MVVAEVGLANPGSNNQGVVGCRLLAAIVAPVNNLLVRVNVLDGPQNNLCVALPLEDLTRCRGNLTLGENSGGDLIEKWLEKVMPHLGNQFDLHIRLCQVAGRKQPTKSRTNDYNTVLAHSSSQSGCAICAPVPRLLT